MAFVLDASVTLSWVFPDEHDDAAALAALDRLRSQSVRVPSVWWYEVRNVLLANGRRQRITEVDTRSFLRFVSDLDIDIDRSPDDGTIFTLARRHRLTVYDTSYLELALRANIPLATLDQKLAAAAKSEGVALIA